MKVIETRNTNDLSASGLRLSGWLVRWDDEARIAGGRREKISPGAFGAVGELDVVLSGHHDRGRPLARTGGGGMTLVEDRNGIWLQADLADIPESRALLTLVKKGVVRGLSLEMQVVRDSEVAGLRIIEEAKLVGASVVDTPAYSRSRVEARQGPGGAPAARTLTASIPVDTPLDCECVPGAKVCKVEFTGDMVDWIVDEFVKAGMIPSPPPVVTPAAVPAPAPAPAPGRDILAVLKDYSRPLASARRGTLRVEKVAGVGLGIQVDLPDTPAGDAVVDAMQASDLYVRPLLVYGDDAEYEDVEAEGGELVRRLMQARVRAFLVGTTDAAEGWPPAVIEILDEVDAGVNPDSLTKDEIGRLREFVQWL